MKFKTKIINIKNKQINQDCVMTVSAENLLTGFPQALKSLENMENGYKNSMHGKFMEKIMKYHGKIMKLCY